MGLLKDPARPEGVQMSALEVVDKLAALWITHEKLVQVGIFDFLIKSFQDVTKSGTNVKVENLKRLARLFDIVIKFGGNPKVSERLISSGAIDNMVAIYTAYKDVTFMRDIFVDSLFEITKTVEGQQLVRKSALNLEEMVHQGVTTQNVKILEKIGAVLTALVGPEEVASRVTEIKSGKSVESNILFLSFVNSGESLNDPALISSALSIVNSGAGPESLYGAVRFLSGLTSASPSNVEAFVSQRGLEVMKKIIDKPDSQILIAAAVDLLKNCIRTDPEHFCQALEDSQIIYKVIDHFCSLNKTFEDFQVSALTTEKALDSIEYYKSEVTRALLESSKEVKQSELVPLKKAIEYIFCESLSVAQLELFQIFFSKFKKSKYRVDNNFINTCHNQMKVFKNSKRVFTSIFNLLYQFSFTKEQVDLMILNLNWPFTLCDFVWRKNGWKYFALYVVRWMENLVANNANIRALTNTTNPAKLIASIQHFINDEDFKDFEGEDVAALEDSDTLTFSEEREIHSKGTKIMEKLVDAATMNTFKTTIDKSIRNFKPIPETIQILRAEYAVMASINGINFFGSEGLKQKIHLGLRANIDELEKIIAGKEFVDKEKLLADCVRSLSNYVCITWNESGKNMYEGSEVSSIVFDLFDKYLRESKRPLTSYVFLKAYKEWLVNRIEIIETVSNAERDKIYDPDSFMMVAPGKREAALQSAMDSLYQTVKTFDSNAKVVSLSYEVIILLGYIYPRWKSKIAKNFIPQALDTLVNEALPRGCDEKAIELLGALLGVDAKSDAPDLEMAKYAAECGGLEKICKAISDNNFSEKFTNKCKPLIELISGSGSQKENEDLIAKLIAIIKKFNALPPNEKTPKALDEAVKAADQLNLLISAPALRTYAFELDHTDALAGLLEHLNKSPARDPAAETLQRRADKAVAVGLRAHLESANDDDKKTRMWGEARESDRGLPAELIKALRRHCHEPEMIAIEARLINSLFPSSWAPVTKAAHRALKFQPELDGIFKNYGSSPDPDLAAEATNLFMNLSDKQDDGVVERQIRKALRELGAEMESGRAKQAADALASLAPYLQHPVFASKFDELGVLDYIVRMEKFEQAQLIAKSGRRAPALLDEALGATGVPDIGSSLVKALEPERALAEQLGNFILNLPEPLREKAANHPEIPKLTDAFLLVHGGTQVFDVINTLMANPKNQTPLSENSAIQNCVLALLKNNKDLFKPAKLEADLSGPAKDKSALLTKSMLHHKVELEKEEDKAAAGPKTAESDALLRRNVENFNGVAKNLVPPKFMYNIIEEYIKAQQSFNPKSEESVSKLLCLSREVAALLQAKIPGVQLEPYAKRLAASALTFLEKSAPEQTVNKKLFRFFENNTLALAKLFDETPLSFRSAPLWNRLMERYFVTSPALFKLNPKRILKLLNLVAPPRPAAPGPTEAFFEPKGTYCFSIPPADTPAIPEASFDKVAANFAKATEIPGIKPQLFYPTFEALTRPTNLAVKLVESPLFLKLVEYAVLFDKHDFLNHFEPLTRALLQTLARAAESPELRDSLAKKFHADNLLLAYISNVEQNREELIPLSLQLLALAFDVLPNKSAFFEKKFVETLAKRIGGPAGWSAHPDELKLLGHLARDPSLDAQFEDAGLFDAARSFTEKNFLPNPPTVQNPPAIFARTTPLSPVPNTKAAEAGAFLMGELSKDERRAKTLAAGPVDVFALYDAFEKLEHDPVIATKIIEACRNGVLQLDEATVNAREKDVDALLPRIPPKIEKFSHNLDLVHVYLKEILDFFKKRAPKKSTTKLEKLAAISTAPTTADRLSDTKGLAEIYKEMAEKTERGPLSAEDSKTLELANVQTKSLLKNPTALFTLANLDVPRYLRRIANAPGSSAFQRSEALELLNGFAKDEDLLAKLLGEPFFVDRGAELIDSLAKNPAKLRPEELAVLNSDLELMKKLTNDPRGANFALSKDASGCPLIDDLFKIIKSEAEDPFVKKNALEVLMNLLKASPDRKLDERVLRELPSLIEKNLNAYELLCALVRLAGTLAGKSEPNKAALASSPLLSLIKKGNDMFPNGRKLQTNTAFALFNLVNDYEPIHGQVLDSGALQPLSLQLRKLDSDKELHENTLRALLQLSFQNPERKERLVKDGFPMGLVALLIHYSSPKAFDPEMCTLVLKAMANFSLVPAGVDVLLADGVIPAFKNFFAEHKEALPLQVKLMMATLSNLSYEPRPQVLDKILADKGLELILDTLAYYAKKGDAETTEVSVDALTHVAAAPKTLDHLTKTNVIDVLTDLLRQKLNDRLVYKDLRCFTRLVESEKLANMFLDKGGHAAALDVLKPFRDDPKVVFQSLKLNATLIDKYPARLEDFVFAGIPEKVISAFKMDWKEEVVKLMIETFAKAAKLEPVKTALATKFLPDLVELINRYYSQKPIVRNGMKLLALCSDNIAAADTIKYVGGNPLADKTLDKHLSSEPIVMHTLELMENMIRMNKDSKPEFLGMKSDDKVENIVNTTDRVKQKELHEQAITVLELLRDKKVEDLGDSTIPDEPAASPARKSASDDRRPSIGSNDLEKLVPLDTQKFLKQGRILMVYGEDAVCRSMHFFVSKDMNDLKCKHPKENFVKQKWIIPIHQVKEIKYGYDKKSPIARSGTLFTSPPPPDKCFAVFGPIELEGPKNFHFVCDNPTDAKRWVEYLNHVMSEYRKIIAANLKARS